MNDAEGLLLRAYLSALAVILIGLAFRWDGQAAFLTLPFIFVSGATLIGSLVGSIRSYRKEPKRSSKALILALPLWAPLVVVLTQQRF